MTNLVVKAQGLALRWYRPAFQAWNIGKGPAFQAWNIGKGPAFQA